MRGPFLLLSIVTLGMNLGSACPFDPGGIVIPGDTSSEPNNSFSQAVNVDLNQNESTTFTGVISPSGDVDVFSLGEVTAGDQVRVRVEAPAGDLDPAIALFDNRGRLIVENDDIDLGVDLTSQVDEPLRRNANPLFLAITNSSFSTTRGRYTARVTITRNVGIPVPRAQTILLNFAGGSLDIANGTTQNSDLRDFSGEVRALDGGAIDAIYEGKTTEIMDAIVATVEQDFARYDVRTLRQAPGEGPLSEPGSTVFVGGFDPGLFGIAEDVDVFNAVPTDKAIVFAETFTPDIFPSIPSADNLGRAIGNIVAHEAGHLLGLNHASNPQEIMDTGSPPSSFLLNQEFMDADLHPDIFPIGRQDAHLLLLETIGPGTGNSAKGPITAARLIDPNALQLDSAPVLKNGQALTKRDFALCFCRKCAGKRIKQTKLMLEQAGQ